MDIHIQVENQRILVDGALLPTRNEMAAAFLGFLAWRCRVRGAPEWVGMDTMGGVVGGAHAAQFRRCLNALEKTGLKPVEYKSRTRGPWRLADTVRSVTFDLSDAELAARFPAPPEPARWQDDDGLLFAVLGELSCADTYFADGALAESQACLAGLLSRSGARLDVEFSVLTQLRLARVAMRQEDWKSAAQALDSAERLWQKQEGAALPLDLSFNLKIARAKLFYDQQQFSHAQAILEHIPIRECRDALTLAQYHGLHGLCCSRCLRLDAEAGKFLSNATIDQSLQTCFGHYQRALGFYLLVGDYFGVQAVCFNIGNLFACCSRHRWAMGDGGAAVHERAIRWLNLCKRICHKHGVGGDSTLDVLVMAQTAVAQSMAYPRFLELTEMEFARFHDWRGLGEAIHDIANRLGNEKDIAESLLLLADIETASGDTRRALEYARKALNGFEEAGEKDMARWVKKRYPNLRGEG